MANHHLRNRLLSLKAKGLLSLMLSLPEDWDYTTKGLAHICKDGVDSICSTAKELEEHGYIIRHRIRNEKGQMTTVHDRQLDRDRLDGIVELLVDTVCSARQTIRVSGDDFSAEVVKSQLLKLDSEHIRLCLIVWRTIPPMSAISRNICLRRF